MNNQSTILHITFPREKDKPKFERTIISDTYVFINDELNENLPSLNDTGSDLSVISARSIMIDHLEIVSKEPLQAVGFGSSSTPSHLKYCVKVPLLIRGMMFHIKAYVTDALPSWCPLLIGRDVIGKLYSLKVKENNEIRIKRIGPPPVVIEDVPEDPLPPKPENAINFEGLEPLDQVLKRKTAEELNRQRRKIARDFDKKEVKASSSHKRKVQAKQGARKKARIERKVKNLNTETIIKTSKRYITDPKKLKEWNERNSPEKEIEENLVPKEPGDNNPNPLPEINILNDKSSLETSVNIRLDRNNVPFVNGEEGDPFVGALHLRADPNEELADRPIEFFLDENNHAVYEPHELTDQQQAELEQLLTAYGDVFGNDTDQLAQSKLTASLRLKANARAKKVAPYRVKPPIQVKIKEILADLADKGVIRRSNSEWASPMLLVAKPDGSMRMVVNFSTGINNELEDDNEPLPLIEDVIESGPRKKYRSTFDLLSSFYQIRLDEESKRLTSFVTPIGQYEFNAVPMGIKVAPQIQQRAMREVFGDYLHDFLELYIDDGLIASETWEEHLKHLQLVFQRLRAYNLKIKLKKCHFALKRIKYVGYVISEDGIHIDNEKVKAINDMPEPRDSSDTRSFLATIGTWRRFIEGFSIIAAPLTELTKQKVPWRWTEVERKAFLDLKSRLISAPILASPDYSLPFKVVTDASIVGASAILMQKHKLHDDSKEWKPVAYASWKFNEQEARWSTTERELYAIVLATRKWRAYLYGRKLKVETDHQILTKSRQIHFDPFNRVNRWLVEIQQYDLDIKYIPGSQNPADSLSRMFKNDEMSYDDYVKLHEGFIGSLSREDSESVDGHDLNRPHDQKDPPGNIPWADGEDVTLPDEQKLAEEQEKDNYFGPIVRYFKRGELPDDDRFAREVVLESENYCIESKSNLLLRISNIKEFDENDGNRLLVCVPKSYKVQVLTRCHDLPAGGAHMGRFKTYDRIKRLYYWKNMRDDINRWVNTCKVCQQVKNPKVSSQRKMEFIMAKRPFQIVSIDLMGPFNNTPRGNEYVMSVVDIFTKTAHAFGVPNKEGVSVARTLCDKVFRHYGVPERIHSDGGGEFANNLMKELKKILGFEKSFTTAYNPSANPHAEKIHHFFRNAIVSYIDSFQQDWDTHLWSISLTYNNVVNPSTGYSPHELNFGRSVRMPGDPKNRKEDEATTYYEDYTKKLDIALRKAYDAVRNLFFEKDNQRKEIKVKETIFEPETQVLLYIPATKPGLARKLVRRWVGPFRIKRRITNKVYELKDEKDQVVARKVSVMRLKPYKDRNIHGPKFLTQELDPRVDFELMRDPVIRGTVDTMKELNDLINDDLFDVNNRSFDNDEEIIDLYVQPFGDNEENSNDDEELDEVDLGRQMVLDDTIPPLFTNDRHLLSGRKHEVIPTENGGFIKERISTSRSREQRLGRGERKPDPSFHRY